MAALLPVLLILGPTAGGKSQLAVDLAMRLPQRGEIISCDSMQIYCGMDIGTAKPSAELRAAVPHHLLDIADPKDDTFSVDRWLELADRAIAEIRAHGRTPIIVGGTNLYIQAFLSGLMEGPPPNEHLRAELNAIEPIALRARLMRVDPAAAERIHANDRKRTIRAIEVFETTGKRLSDQQTQWAAAATPHSQLGEPKSIRLLGLEYPVEIINRRINARVKAMIDAGLVDEVKRLHGSNALGRNAREALGYKQIIEHLEGRCTLEEAIEQIKIRTRRYAKQQRTWLRRFKIHPNAQWIDAGDFTHEDLAERSLAVLSHILAVDR